MKHRLLNLPRPLLAGLAKCYSSAVQLRLALYRTGYLKSKRLNAFTISIGNISVGGTGKTPLVETIARRLTERGYRVAILTRGYGRKHGRRRQLVTDGQQTLGDVTLTGDEPLMLAGHLSGVPIIADADRWAAGKWAEEKFDIDVCILDDAFQHLALERDVNLVVIDALDPFGGEQPLPLGRLREPLSELARASGVIVSQSDRPFDQTDLKMKLATLTGEKPIFHAYRDLTSLWDPLGGQRLPPQRLSRRPVAILCAIGRPEHFRDDIRHFGARVVDAYPFPDHHRYSQPDVERAFSRARARGAAWVLTTEKDWMRLQRLTLPASPALKVVTSEMIIVEEAQLLSLILRSMEGERSLPPLPSA